MEFRILGPLEVQQNGHSLPCKGVKQRLLLATLLLRANEVVSSDQLMEALWGESPPPTANKALQMHVSQLRRLLGPARAEGGANEILSTRAPGYRLNVEPGQLDLDRFESGLSGARRAAASGQAQAAAQMLVDALGIWRGSPLSDLYFEQSLQPDIARLEELRLSAVEEKIEAELALGRHSGVIGELEALVAEQPLRERIREQLMLALYRAGRQAEALELYRETRRMLVEELGIEPTHELKELEARILSQDPGLQVAPRPAAGEAAERHGVVGREREFAQLLPIVDAAAAGQGGVVLIAGEPGIGKSRLSEALARHAHERGAHVGVGRCWEAGGAPPYWPWVQALRSWLRELDADPAAAPALRAGPELAALLPELGGPPEPDPHDSPGSRFRLFDSVVAFLRSGAESRPLALFLDDLQAADAESLLLLRFVAAEIADAPILIVACYRDGEGGPALGEALGELAREPIVHRATLKGIDESAVARLLGSVMESAPAEGLVRRVHAETHGNPLFAGEIGRLLADEGVPDDASARLPIPDGVREAIRRRLQSHSENCRELLKFASILGREFELAALTRASGVGDDELADALDEAAAARLISEVPGSSERLRFSHILVRDTIYDDLPVARRRRMHLTVAEALEAGPSGAAGSRVAQLAHHCLAAGGLAPEKALDYSERAGAAAAAQHGYEEAARYYSTALGLIETSTAGDADRSCRLLLALGDALSRAGSGTEAKSALRRAADIAEQHGWPERMATAALAYGGRFAWARASTDPALVPLLERALSAVAEGDDGTRARLLARLAAATRDDAVSDRRIAWANEAVGLARRGSDLTTLAYTLEGFWLAVETFDPSVGVHIGDELIAIGAKLGDDEHAFLGHDFRLHGMWSMTDRAGVDVEVAALGRIADELRQPAHRWHAEAHRTMVALMEGRFAEAESLIAQTRLVGERAEAWNAVVTERLQLFTLRHAQGRLEELEETLARSVHEYPALLRFRCVLAHVHSALGSEQRAREELESLLACNLGSYHVDAEWVFAINLLPDVCQVLGHEDGAAEVYDLLLPCADLYAEAPAEATFGSAARGLGVVATVLGRLDDAERHFGKAAEIEQRMRSRPWAAHVQLDLARMLIRRGGKRDRTRAATALAEAVAGYRELGMDSWAERARALRISPSAASA